MSEFVHETQQEFWRPPAPVIAREVLPAMAEACPGCGAEFLLGSRFCHSCGGRRPEFMSTTTKADAAAVARLWAGTINRMRSLFTGIPWRKMKSVVRVPGWFRNMHFPSLRFPQLHFQEIKGRLGLPTASLVAFAIGLGCVLGALFVAFLDAKTLVDWQAIQFYRAEWLLAAIASFVVGILLKKTSGDGRD